LKKVYIFVPIIETIKTMDKPTQKNVTIWNREAINILSERKALGKNYIKKIILGERKPINADDVKKEYKLICHNLNELKTIAKLK
jgi:hypothetical protein